MRTFWTAMSATRWARDRRANVAITFGLMSPLLVVALGAALDYGLAAKNRTGLQSALDAAVLAGVEASATKSQTAAIAVATNVFTADAPADDSGATSSFTFNSDGSLSGSASANIATLYGAFTGHATMALGVSAKAKPSANTVCILLLDPSASPGLLLNSGATITTVNCEVDVASQGDPAATFNAGATLSAERICLAGADYIDNGGVHPNLASSCNTASNPYVGALPAPPSTSCTGPYANGGNFSGTVTLSPGVYCGGFNFNNAPTVTLQPGVYVISGGSWNVDGGSWTGTGVTFYFADASHIQYNSGMAMSLSAPTSGAYAGILFYEKDGLALSPFIFDDSVSESLSGLIYLPSRQITLNSASTVSAQQLTLIADTATFNTVNWTLSAASGWSPQNASGGGASLSQ